MNINPRYMSADEAVGLIENGDHVYIQGSTSTPEVLCRALAERGTELRNVTLYSAFAVCKEEAPYCKKEYLEAFNVESFFVSNGVRKWIQDGYGSTIPRFLGEVPALMRDGTCRVDVALLNCSMPNDEGLVSFGVSADLATEAVECADRVIAQINPQMPFSEGDAVINIADIDACVQVDEPLVEVPTAVPTDAEIRIGSYIAELIPDGATLQIGVGG
ncbi:MAG: 4-hydroxybutyrate CoA-transferase, partial [Muribaculaceae bacterium]|nr:4-hydroxybutyrate CoA-transferase [Muribaculaceae bacterium]